MATTTPFVKRMRTQGGTIYTFTSALEDIGLNINERNNVVKMSNYALLNIPSVEVADSTNLQANKFNVFAIEGAYQNFLNDGSPIKDGRVIIAESFQNYALNLETNLLARTDYNPTLQQTISERVFWKWLKETGSIRWQPIDTSAGVYWQEETDSDVSTGYNSVVKCIGQISAGSVRTDTFGTYNETYILVPTSFGQTPVYFKQVEDDNYKHGIAITNGYTNIKGRETYTKPHPDGLSYRAQYDLQDSSTDIGGTITLQYDNSTGWLPGWWWTPDTALPISLEKDYFIDSSSYLTTGLYNIELRYVEPNIRLRRSKVDCLSVEFDIDHLKTIYSDSTLTFDKLALSDGYSIDDNFDFNAVLLYYSVYTKTLDKVLATNLLGILFLDPPSGNSNGYPGSVITLPSITKLQSGENGFGTSYSFRLNIKSDYLLDDTQAIVTDSTASQTTLEDFSEILDNLNKTLTILNEQTGTISYITEQYLDITTNQTNIENQISDLQNQVNTITRDITGTPNTLAMFIEGDDPIGDSSIYMKNGKVGIFTDNPVYPVQIDVSVKTKDLIIENAIRDVSGNILLGYGSPLQLGSSTNYREIRFYTGDSTPALTIDSSNAITFGTIPKGGFIMEASLGSKFYWDSGYLEPSTGSGDVTKIYVDGSLNDIRASYIPSASLGSGFSWSAGTLIVDVSTAGSGITYGNMFAYVDPSLAKRDSSISDLYSTRYSKTQIDASFSTFGYLNSSLGTVWTKFSYVDVSLQKFTSVDASINRIDASVSNMYLKSQVDSLLSGKASTSVFSTGNGLVPGTPSSKRFLMGEATWSAATDTSITNIYAKNADQDTSILSLDSVKANKTSPVFTTSFGMGNWAFDLSGNNLQLKYNNVPLFIFYTDGSMYVSNGIQAYDFQLHA